MTTPASARAVGSQRLGARLPSATERASANQLRRIIAAQGGEETKIKVTGEHGKPADVILTEGLSTLLLELLRYIEQGDAVTLVPVTQMLTTQQAADILNVSRPFLIQLLERGAIGFTTTGRHRRIKAEDLFRYKAQRDQTRADALSELAELDASLI
jgi:excisionase family DNA binding protein